MRYAVITPVRNEAEFIEKTIHSMIQQTIKPTEWVIVNDGSTDETEQIIQRYTTNHPWIKLVNRADRGTRQRGKGVVEAFYDGYKTLTLPYEFIVKLDGDLSFDPDYFETLGRKFSSNPQLGIAGGGVYEKLDGQKWTLDATRDHVRGPTKVYRRACFEEIGGLVPMLGWDGLDEWQALTMGWEVQSFLELKVFHYRITGAATGSLKARLEQGQGAYTMNYHPLYLIARGLYHLGQRPYVIGGIAMILGYVNAWLRRREQIAEPDVVSYIHRTQLKKLATLWKHRLAL